MRVLHILVFRIGSTFSFSTRFIVTACVVALPWFAGAQELQRQAFTFLNTSPSARVAGLGGRNVSLSDRDVNTFYSNPATVSDSLAGMGSLNYQFYVGDIGHAAFTYLNKYRKAGLLAIGVDHFSYGTIESFDATGAPLGTFKASETAIVISRSHQINNFRMGVSLKGVFGSMAGFRSSAIMADIGGVFMHPEDNWQVGLVLKNAGFLLSDYTETSDSRLPVDLQVGASIKPEYMPLRFSVTIYRLIESKGVEYSQNQAGDPGRLKNVLRHFNFGTELLLHRNINLLAGYNYGVHQEMRLQNAGGSAGISYGFSARIKTVEFVFSRSTFVSRSAGYAFALSTNINRFVYKK